jgi:hypothetical protein
LTENKRIRYRLVACGKSPIRPDDESSSCITSATADHYSIEIDQTGMVNWHAVEGGAD